MAETSDLSTGGHTYVPDTDACETCHAPTDDFDRLGVQTAVQELLDKLSPLLEEAGILTWQEERSRWRAVPGTYPANTAAALWNFLGIVNDGTLGVHNPHYIVGLARGSITEMGGSW